MVESLAPMLAQPLTEIPRGSFFYEPKWDGFRAIVTIDERPSISSRDQKDLTPYFPELVTTFAEQLPHGAVIDGEIVVVHNHRMDFAALQQRIHPAKSRIDLLARTTPASFIAFDLLSLEQGLEDQPFRQRRTMLETLRLEPPLYITACTRDFDEAKSWFSRFHGGGVDGIVAKPGEIKYLPGERAMYKIKHFYSADCVVAGFRPSKNDAESVGALLLGIFDSEGHLQYVGSTSSFSRAVRKEMAAILKPLQTQSHVWLTPVTGQRVPGTLSRWSGKKDMGFIPLKPRIVCEVRYDQLEGERFRHATTFLRWRPDRAPESCTYDQLVRPETFDLGELIHS